MWKFVVTWGRVNFLRHFVRLNKCREHSCPPGTSALRLTSELGFHTSRRNDAVDSRIRDMYEYPDVEKDEEDVKLPYTNWEGVEKRHAHSVMEKNKLYDSTIAIIPVQNTATIARHELADALRKNWRLEPLSELVRTLRRVSHYARENNEDIYADEYEALLAAVAVSSKLFSDDQLLHVLKSLSLWFIQTNDEDSAYFRLYTAFDKECESRARSWSTEKQLLVLDHWYRLRLIRRSKFVTKTLMSLGSDPATLSPENIVQLMFYVSISRSKLVDFRGVEMSLNRNAELLNVDELAVVSLGFFKSQSAIRDRKLLGFIIRRTIGEIESIDDMSLTAILKIVRYSIHLNDLGFLCKLLENAIPQIPRLSVSCLVHLILAATNRSLFYAEMLNAVTARFYSEISKLRMKDIRCLAFALSSFNYIPEKQPNICDKIIEELNESNRQDEMKLYPRCFATCLHHLSILNVHPKNLIAQALNPENVEKAYGSDVETIRREIFALDLDIEAEIPDYKGPRLDNQTRKDVAVRLTNLAPVSKNLQLTHADYLMLDVIRACEEYFGSKEMVYADHVLPQYQHPDIIICFDKSNFPIPLSSTLSKLPFGNVKHPPKLSPEDIRWFALIIGTSNSYAKNTKRLLGHISAKYRQLEYIGYTPHVIFWQDWIQLRNDNKKYEYLRTKVFP